MELLYAYLIVLLLLSAGLVWLFYFLLKSMIKALFLAGLVFTIFFLVLGYLVYSDVTDFSKKFATEKKLFLLHENGTVLTGFSATSFDAQGISVFGQEEISRINSAVKGKNYESILDNNYKIVSFDAEIFEGEGTIRFEGVQIPKQVYVQALESDSPTDVFADYYVQISNLGPSQRDEAKKQAEAQLGTDVARIKASIFTMLMNDAVEKQGGLFLINLKNGKISIYPETITFKILKLAPDFIFEKVGNQISV